MAWVLTIEDGARTLAASGVIDETVALLEPAPPWVPPEPVEGEPAPESPPPETRPVIPRVLIDTPDGIGIYGPPTCWRFDTAEARDAAKSLIEARGYVVASVEV
jgi:hypothetical protein